jgi:hypothetical protein
MYLKHPGDHTNEPISHSDGRRLIKRRHLIYYLRVWDSGNQQFLGHVVDITEEGMMLISESEIPVGESYQLEIRLPELEGIGQPMRFTAVCRWSHNDINPSFYDSGFEFTEKEPSGIETLQKMIEEYGFQD